MIKKSIKIEAINEKLWNNYSLFQFPDGLPTFDNTGWVDVLKVEKLFDHQYDAILQLSKEHDVIDLRVFKYKCRNNILPIENTQKRFYLWKKEYPRLSWCARVFGDKQYENANRISSDDSLLVEGWTKIENDYKDVEYSEIIREVWIDVYFQ